MRENVLRELARKASTDPEFLRGVRRDLQGTLVRYGYDLTAEELKTVEDLRRRTAIVGDGTLAAMLASGLMDRSDRSGGARPANPAPPGQGRSRPAPPGTPRYRREP